MREYHVYILASLSRRVYVGVTNDLLRRVGEHKAGVNEGFATRYRVNRLVYFESSRDIHAAIAREKQIKRWTRSRKYHLIGAQNAGWSDLSLDWLLADSTHTPAEGRSRHSVAEFTPHEVSGLPPAG